MEEKQDVKYASFSTRVLALAFDFTVITLVLSPIMPYLNKIMFGDIDIEQFYVGSTNKIDASGMMSYLSNQNFFLKYFLYQLSFGIFIIIIFTLSNIKLGNTLGKWILGYKVVDADALNTPTNKQFIQRGIGYIVSSIPFLLGFFTMPWTERSQCWHDKIANTVVIKVRHDFTWLSKIKSYITDLTKRKFVR